MAKSTTFSESNISIEKNTSSLTINIWFSAQNSTTWFGSATLYCTCNGSTQSAVVSHSKGGAVSASFTFHNIKHNDDGNKSVSWSWSCATGTGGLGTQSDSGTKALTTIPRGSTLGEIDYFNFGDTVSFPIKKNVDSYYDVLEIGFFNDDGSQYNSLKIVENVSDGFEWIPTNEELNIIYENTPSRDFRTLTFYLKTYIDSTKATQIGDTNTSSSVGMIVNADPTFTNFSYEDVNERTIALTGSSSKIINGYSTLRISNLICNANKGAVLQLIQINDNQYAYTDNFTIDLEKWNNSKITIYVIDSRNNSTKLEVLIGINFINYKEKVIANKTCLREGSINEESILSFNGTWFNSSFGAATNSLSASYKYKETGNDEWIDGITTLSLTISNNNYSFENYIKGDTDLGFSTDKSYDIQIIVTDLLGNKSTTTILVAGEPSIDIYKSNVAFGGIYDENTPKYQAQFKKAVNFEGEIYINGAMIGGGEFATGGESLPIGSMIPFGSDTNIPSNWKICDGSEVSRETYADLFNVIGTSYGEGDGETTFNLPNKQGRISVGLDTEQEEFNNVGKKGGSKEHTHSVPVHNHGLNNGFAALNIGGGGIQYYEKQVATWGTNASINTNSSYNNYVNKTWGIGLGGATDNNIAGNTGSESSLPPYEVDIWIIKVSNLVSSLDETTGSIIDNLTSTSTTDALSANQGRILNEKYNWKLYATTTGTVTTTLPTDYNELYIEVSRTGYTDPIMSIYVPKTSLTSSARTFRNGYYFNSSVHGAIGSQISLTTYRTGDLYISGTAYNSTALNKIYYR